DAVPAARRAAAHDRRTDAAAPECRTDADGRPRADGHPADADGVPAAREPGADGAGPAQERARAEAAGSGRAAH
ncbi:hypothetical protein ACWD6S_36055, partial [Streptomyces zhihengii]